MQLGIVARCWNAVPLNDIGFISVSKGSTIAIVARAERSERRHAVVENAKVQQLALIVDDDEKQRKFLVAMVEAAGFRIEEASGGGEALAVIRRTDPALVFLHLQTPD